MSQAINTSPHMKSDKPYSQSPSYKRQHPFNAEASVSLKNSINLKDLQINEELEYYKHRCADLESYVRQLKNELDTTIIRLSKQGALDEKVELVLRQNNILSQDLDKIQKNYAQKKTECELWKTKYEQQLNAAVQQKAAYELDLRKIHIDLKNLEERNQILERERTHDIEATKTNLSIQNEQQRHNYLQQMEILENQLRKVRDYAEQRDKELYDLETKYSMLSADRDLVENRLIKEIDSLRIKHADQEREHSIELNNQRQKLDILNQGQIENIRKQYMTQLDIMDTEIEKLKGLLDIKNTEIETLIMQNQRLRQNYDEEVQTVRLQFNILKEKMLENEQNFQNEADMTEHKLREQYQEQTNNQAQRFQSEIAILEQQIGQLRSENQLAHQEIQELQRERLNLIDTHKQDKHSQQQHIENQHQNLVRRNSVIGVKEKQIDTLMNTYASIKQQLVDRLLALQVEFEKLSQKHQTAVTRYEAEIKSLEWAIKGKDQQILALQNQSSTSKQRLQQLNEQIREQQRKYSKQVSELQTQVKEGEQHYKNLEQELKDLQEEQTQASLQRESENESKTRELQQQHAKEVDQLKQQFHQAEDQANDVIAQLKAEVENSKSNHQIYLQKLAQLEQEVQQMVEAGEVDQTQLQQTGQDINLLKRLQ